MSNPFISNKKIRALYFSIWFFISQTQVVLLTAFLDVKLFDAYCDSLVFNFLYMALGLSFWFTVSFNSLENYSTAKVFFNHLAAAVITSGLWVLAGYYIVINLLTGEKEYLEFISKSLVWRFLIGMLFYIVIISVDYVIIYYTNFQEKLLKESELNALVKESELKSLKYQINPHFIFNSLNSISSLTISNPPQAQEMTIKLSSFLRSILSKNEKQKNKLIEEINNARLYMDIEKVRFAEKFEFIDEIKDECKELEVPSMILQPIFENAIKHGVYESLDKVTIRLSCGMEKEYFKITVENNFDPDSIPRKGEGIGLKNIRNRLKLIYNQENLLTIQKENNIFRVNIYIPV
ncbi:MAG: histidine kinase, partial [Melioribacteraceae bacterium]